MTTAESKFRAFADGTRLRLLALLRQQEMCVCDLVSVLKAPQPTISRHLAHLRKAGLVINEAGNGAITHVGIALTFGLVILAMIYTFGEISGAHFNPAVTIGFLLARRFRADAVLPYIVSQSAGAIAPSLVLHFLFPGNKDLGRAIPAGAEMQSFVLELIITFLLMVVILRVSTGAKEKGITAGIVVGSVRALEAMFTGPICGASMNPARSFGPALVSRQFDHLWIYLVATTLGAALAVPICKTLESE